MTKQASSCSGFNQYNRILPALLVGLVPLYFVARGLKPRKIKFDHMIFTSLSPDALWEQLETSFRDSRLSGIWPNDLEELRSNGLAEDAVIHGVCQLPLARGKSLDYRITRYRPGNRFTFQPMPGHPFQGEGTVEVLPGNTGSVLKWWGEYTYKGFTSADLFFKYYYEKKFFADLARKIKQLERKAPVTAAR